MFSNIDDFIFFFINHTLANPVCDVAVKFLNKIPGVFFIILIGAVGLFAGKKYTKISSLIFLSSYAISIAAYRAVKLVIERPRPFEVLDNVRLLLGPRNGFSFPSGHATTSFCLATVIAMRYPKMRYPIFIAATLVALSRPYIGVHYPSDILAGSVLGILVGYFVTKTANKLWKDKA
jgi:undecaprenyl-diphosphatase